MTAASRERTNFMHLESFIFLIFLLFFFFFFLLGIVTEICIIFDICTCSYRMSLSAFQHWQTQQVLLHSTYRISRRNSGFISICVIHFHFNYLLLDLENVSNSYLIAGVVSRREETNRITVMPFTGMARTKEEAERSMGKFILLERSYDLAISCRAINSICLLRYLLRTSHSYVEDTALLTRIKHLSVCMWSHIFRACYSKIVKKIRPCILCTHTYIFCNGSNLLRPLLYIHIKFISNNHKLNRTS